MYPSRELSILAGRKAALRREIALHRTRCAEAAARVARPLACLDRALAAWRRLPPLARFTAISLGFRLQSAVFPRLKFLGPLFGWSSLAIAVIRIIASDTSNREGSRVATSLDTRSRV